MSLWRVLLAAAAVAGAAASASVWAADAGGPAWNTLTPAQRQALAPLQRGWDGIEPNRKQKWLEVAGRFPTMPAEDRQRLQQRMADWSNLTPADRARARMQYQEVRQLPAEERQARWQAYQALSDDERKTLAQRAKPPGRAASGIQTSAAAEIAKRRSTPVEAVTAKRNMVQANGAPVGRAIGPTVLQARPGATTTPMSTKPVPPSHNQAGLPKIAATPGYVDPATLLPRRGPQGAAVRSAAASDPTEQP